MYTEGVELFKESYSLLQPRCPASRVCLCASKWVLRVRITTPCGWRLDTGVQAGAFLLCLAEAWLCPQFTARSLLPNCTISAWCHRARVRMDGLQLWA